MRCFIIIFCLSLTTCKEPETKRAAVTETPLDDTILTPDTDSIIKIQEDSSVALPAEQTIKIPSGIYSFNLPFKKGITIQHIVRFFRNRSFKLQERYYSTKGDSVVISEGTWSPSNGFIWLYSEQVVRGRYQWKENILQYYNPSNKKFYPMQEHPELMENKVWQKRKADGITFFGIGNEPFWSIENSNDSLKFLLADWSQPVILPLKESILKNDSLIYRTSNDTSGLIVLLLPYFCSDGMSDYIYPREIRVTYKGQSYSGCGVLYRQ